MWALRNTTPYAAERTWLRDKSGVHQWIVVVKATFEVTESGKVSLASEQAPPVAAPEHHGEPGRSSLKYEADLVLPKSTTDVLCIGNSYAPKGQPVRKLAVALRVGPVRKELVVFGTRVYYSALVGAALSKPAEFVVRPMTYEWAYGGTDLTDPDPKKQAMDPRNPVGKGVVSRA